MIGVLKSQNANVIKDNQKGSNLAGVDKITKSETLSTATFRSLDEHAIEQTADALRISYQRGHRNSIIFGLGGLLFKSSVSLQSAQDLVARLCDHMKMKKRVADWKF